MTTASFCAGSVLRSIGGSSLGLPVSPRSCTTGRSSADGFAAHLSGRLGIDLGQFDPDQPIGEIDSNGLKGFVRSLIEAAPDHTWTWGQLMERTSWGSPVVGAPEQIADVLQQYAEAGVNGINVMYVTTPGSFEDFIEGAAPELRRRGLMQTEYAPGTLPQAAVPILEQFWRRLRQVEDKPLSA